MVAVFILTDNLGYCTGKWRKEIVLRVIKVKLCFSLLNKQHISHVHSQQLDTRAVSIKQPRSIH